MTEYKASNGITVDSETQGITGRRRITFDHGNHGTSVEMSAEEAVALIESLDHEKDEELGRWRDPDNPDYFVLKEKKHRVRGVLGDFCYRSVTVVQEKPMRLAWRTDRDPNSVGGLGEPIVNRGDEEFAAAARAYFKAHPERKPYEDAQPGDVWAIEVVGEESFTVNVVAEIFGAVSFQTPTGRKVDMNNSTFTGFRKIWPEDAS